MMRILAIALSLLSDPVQAQLATTGAGGVSVGAGVYVGPGDIQSGATAWYGLRAYNTAYAAGSNKAINVRRASDNTTQDINILSNGTLDTASVNTFAGIGATCTASMVGTQTLTVTSCASGTLRLYDQINGAGIVQPAYISVLGTCATPPGSCTINSTQTFSSETITSQTATYVTKFYDQSGHVADCTPALVNNQPAYIPQLINGKPGVFFFGAQICTATIASTTLAYWQFVYNRISGAAGQAVLSMFSSGNQGEVGPGTTNLATMYSGANFSVTANDNVFHGAQGITGTSAIFNIDGTETSGNSGAGAAATSFAIGANVPGSSAFSGYFMEGGLW